MRLSVSHPKLNAAWVMGVLLASLVVLSPAFCDSASSAAPNTPASVEQDTRQYRATHFPWAVVDSPERVAELIKNGEDVNAIDEDGRTALHFAVYYNHYGTVKMLLDSGANVNVKEHSHEGGFGGWGWYPLHLALRNEDRDMIRLLIDHGADVNAVRTDGWTPLYTAAYHGQPDMIALLISKGANVRVGNSEPLRIALSQNKLEAAKVMLEHGADVNGRDGAGRTALELASGDDISAVKLLIEKNAKVNLADNEGKTPLFEAAYAGRVDIAKLLISKGANVNARTKADMSILQAVSAGKKAYLTSSHQPGDQANRDWYGVRSVLLRHKAKG